MYPCFCTRKRIRAEIAHAGQAPHGPVGEAVYPGICRSLEVSERRHRIQAGEPFALRLDVARALELTGPLTWYDVRVGTVPAKPEMLGDVVLARKDIPTSYHLAVTVDDARQGVTLITRGEDLFHATHVHRLLQALLGLRTPRYYHHNSVADANGLRLAKRNQAMTLAAAPPVGPVAGRRLAPARSAGSGAGGGGMSAPGTRGRGLLAGLGLLGLRPDAAGACRRRRRACRAGIGCRTTRRGR